MNEESAGFRILDHTADVAIEAWGADLSQLLANAARGMFRIMADVDTVRGVTVVPVTIEGTDLEDLLVSWLGELVFLAETRSLVFCDVSIRAARENRVEGEALGERIDLDRHSLCTEIKAVTYHGCWVRRGTQGDPWRATVLLDI